MPSSPKAAPSGPLVATIALVAVTVGFSIWVKSQVHALQDEPQNPVLKVGEFAPEISLTALDGTVHTLAQERAAGHTVILNFWASWCGPCRLEMPDLVAFYNEHKDEGVAFFGINEDEKPAERTAYLQEHPLPYPVLIDPQSSLERAWHITGIPTTIVIGPDGRIKTVVEGVDGYIKFQLEAQLPKKPRGKKR